MHAAIGYVLSNADRVNCWWTAIDFPCCGRVPRCRYVVVVGGDEEGDESDEVLVWRAFRKLLGAAAHAAERSGIAVLCEASKVLLVDCACVCVCVSVLVAGVRVARTGTAEQQRGELKVST
jgi:hypothetical protein